MALVDFVFLKKLSLLVFQKVDLVFTIANEFSYSKRRWKILHTSRLPCQMVMVRMMFKVSVDCFGALV